jgi:hypothetical protein
MSYIIPATHSSVWSFVHLKLTQLVQYSNWLVTNHRESTNEECESESSPMDLYDIVTGTSNVEQP